jgi:hypothetical protein
LTAALGATHCEAFTQRRVAPASMTMATGFSSISSTPSSGLPPNTSMLADVKSPASTPGVAPTNRTPSARTFELACGGGAPQPHIEFTSSTNPATIAHDLAAAAKTQGGPVREFTVYAVRDQRIDLYQANGQVTHDPSRAIGELHTRGGCGPGLQKPET